MLIWIERLGWLVAALVLAVTTPLWVPPIVRRSRRPLWRVEVVISPQSPELRRHAVLIVRARNRTAAATIVMPETGQGSP